MQGLSYVVSLIHSLLAMMSALSTRHHDYYYLWCILAGTVAKNYILPENAPEAI